MAAAVPQYKAQPIKDHPRREQHDHGVLYADSAVVLSVIMCQGKIAEIPVRPASGSYPRALPVIKLAPLITDFCSYGSRLDAANELVR
jgi:hypothetical protein